MENILFSTYASRNLKILRKMYKGTKNNFIIAKCLSDKLIELSVYAPKFFFTLQEKVDYANFEGSRIIPDAAVKFISNLNAPSVSFNEDKTLTISGIRFRDSSVSLDTFSRPELATPNTSLNFEQQTLIDAFCSVQHSIGNDYREELKNILVEGFGDTARIVTSNGYVLTSRIISGNGTGTVLVPQGVTQAIVEIDVFDHSNTPDKIYIDKDDVNTRLNFGPISAYWKTGDDFPKWEKAIPKVLAPAVSMKSFDIGTALDTIRLLNKMRYLDYNRVTLEYGEDGFVVSCFTSKNEHILGGDLVSFPIESSGFDKPFSVDVNVNYLDDAISNVPSQEVSLTFYGDNLPIMVSNKADSYHCWIMLIRKIKNWR